MTTTIPVIRAKMGSTEYFEAKMRARELVQGARLASELEKWSEFTIEERLQRELNDSRVEKEIAPYLTNSPDRFFGSIVVLVYNGDVTFESLKELGVNLKAAYKRNAEEIGFLTIEGGELIILDGQHRWAALREVTQGKATTGEFRSQVPDDELCVLFIPHRDNEHTRRIFNKINRSARPTGRSDNIITSEDDGRAILTRWLMRTGEPLGSKNHKGDLIVNWKSNTITDRSSQFTTVSAVYESLRDILACYNIQFDEKKDIVRPDDAELDVAYEHVKTWWEALLSGLTGFQQALADTVKLPEMRKPSEPFSLLMKPAAHIVLARALADVVDRGLNLDEAIRRADKIDWRYDSDLWKHVLILPTGRIVARAENYNVTAALIAYLVAPELMGSDDLEATRVAVGKMKVGPDKIDGYTLPAPVKP